MLQVRNLKKTFRPPDDAPAVPVVDVESFSLGAGEQVALLGSSGSGKTTLLHMLAGILAPDSGSIEYSLGQVGGKLTRAALLTADPDRPTIAASVNIATMSESQRDHFRGQHIGYIFQTHHLLPGLTALENVLLGMSFTGRHADKAWATHLLERVGLSHRLAYKPGKMSMGQQQRVAVARALANRPQLVLADEPTGALDSVTAQQTMDLIHSLCTEARAALLMVTHDLSIAAKLPKQLQLSAINRAAQPSPAFAGGVA